MSRKQRRAPKRAKAIQITGNQGGRLVENTRLLLTFIDANIPKEVTEPNRDGRMAGARAFLHAERTGNYYGDLAFGLLQLADFLMANYSGQARVVLDAFNLLCELGIMHMSQEKIEPGHPLYGKTMQEFEMVADPKRFNKPMRDPERIERIEHIGRAIGMSLGAHQVHIDDDNNVYIQMKGEKTFTRYKAGDKVKRMLSGAAPVTPGEWDLLPPD
jgi:hypothetical protein